MPVNYVSVEEAIERTGLRMVVVGNVPSPWGEAAKGILHIKSLDWAAVRLVYDSEPLKQWAGQRSGPIAIYDNEPPRAGWAEILLLAERLAPAPSLVPADATERATMFGLAHEICGEGGLGWTRRLQLIQAGLQKSGGFSERVSQYLGRKYGYSAAAGASAGERVTALLRMLAARLNTNRYYLGDQLTAVDIYSATFMALFRPLPPEQCAMDEASRDAFETLDAATEATLDPLLLRHRDMMYAEHLELPLIL